MDDSNATSGLGKHVVMLLLLVALVQFIDHIPSAVGADRTAPITAMITIQDTQGTSEVDLNIESLKNLEKWLIQTTLQRARANYAKRGFDPKTFNPKINVGSVYTLVGGKKLAVIKMGMDNQLRTVWIMGFQRGEFLRVTCIRGSDHDIPIWSGECGQKVVEAFGVSVKPQIVQ